MMPSSIYAPTLMCWLLAYPVLWLKKICIVEAKK